MTPIETYNGIIVKRDDLCFDPPAPPFSKCRGIIKHLKKLKKEGITTVGYTETSCSMAGWGVSWACKKLGMTAVIFDPQYKETPEILAYHRTQWKKFEAVILPIPAGMAKVNWYIAKKMLNEMYGNKGALLPLGLPFEETIQATKNEMIDTWMVFNNDLKPKTVVCCVGSGTIIAGIWQGLNELKAECSLYGIMTRTGNVGEKLRKIEDKAKLYNQGMFKSFVDLKLIDPGWQYTEKSNKYCPFPCHPYYDLKAWIWLEQYKNILKKPILFWNIGH